MATETPEEVLSFFAASPIRPMLQLSRAASGPESAIREPLDRFLASFTSEEVAAARDDPQFRFFSSGQVDCDREARVWIAERRLLNEIPRRKLDVVREDRSSTRPRPYSVPALADLEVDSDHMVRLSAFAFDGARLTRNGQAFLVLTTTGSPNSTYWLLLAIYSQGLQDRTRVRLDPFLFGPEESFPAMRYLMWIHGRPLDWARLEALSEPEFGRWRPDSPSRNCEFTDFAWTPRGREVHFVCEEVPSVDRVDREPARYLHAVYHCSAKAICHLDGALRLYSGSAIRDRLTCHVRNAGKAGVREKVFGCKGLIEADDLSSIAQAFFVWNSDVQEYFCRSALP